MFRGLQMDGFAIAGCAAIFILFVIIAWQVYSKKRRPKLQSSVIIAESLQPQVVCRSVPCQHPYYRVISEYSGQDVPKELMPTNGKSEEGEKSSRKFDYMEWSRSLSLGSLSRKSSHPASSSRRSSMSDVGRALRPASKSKPYFVA